MMTKKRLFEPKDAFILGSLLIVWWAASGVFMMAEAADPVQLPPGGSINIVCQQSSAPPVDPPTQPPVDPPAGNCPGAAHAHVLTSQIRTLVQGEMKFSINGHGAVAFRFVPNQIWPGITPAYVKRFTYVPHSSGTGSRTQSKTHTLSFSECPGDFREKIPSCTGNGSEGSIRVQAQAGNGRYCDLLPNKTYYLNVTARTPAGAGFRATPGGGILVKVPR